MSKLGLILFASSVFLSASAASSSFKEIDKIRIGGAGRWDYITVDSARHRLYVSHATATEVVDTSANTLVGTIQDTPGVHGIAIAPSLGVGFISDGGIDAVTVFDLVSLKTVAKIKVGQNPDAILFDPASRRVMTFNGKSHDVTIIDAEARKVVATVPVGGKPEFAQLDSSGHAWFNVDESNELAVLDPRAGKLIRRIALTSCEGPSGLTIDDQQRLYAVCDNKQMVVVAADGKVLGHAAIGAGADGVAWLDGAACSANGDDGTISVVRETAPRRFEVVETFATAVGARTIAADPATHRLYLPASSQLQPVGAAKRRIGFDGSFYVLVLEKQP